MKLENRDWDLVIGWHGSGRWVDFNPNPYLSVLFPAGKKFTQN
jgi:hypothetical protein